MEGEGGELAGRPRPEDTEAALVALRSRVGELRLEILRLRASRRTLMALLEMESRRKSVLEERLERLRARLRGERMRRRAWVRSASGDGH